MMGKEKPVWRLAFFSRLEERKGIKLFVDAVSALNVTNDRFEVGAPSCLLYRGPRSLPLLLEWCGAPSMHTGRSASP